MPTMSTAAAEPAAIQAVVEDVPDEADCAPDAGVEGAKATPPLPCVPAAGVRRGADAATP